MLSRDMIMKYFRELAKLLYDKGKEAEIWVYGGTVMALKYGSRSMTHDIDSEWTNAESFEEAAEAIRKKYGLDSNWINDQIKALLTGSETFDIEPFLELPGLTIWFADGLTMLAMKIRAGRDYSPDLDDIKWLLQELSIRNREEALYIFRDKYPTVELPDTSSRVIDEFFSNKS